MITNEIVELANTLWNYLCLNQPLKKADCILALGSQDARVAEKAAELYLNGWAPMLIFSGGAGRLTKGLWAETEADTFAQIALSKGVPSPAVLIENRSTNTGENILFTQQLLEQKKLSPRSFLLVQKPYMERRSFATFKKQWPGKELFVTSPEIAFANYPTIEIPVEKVINLMVGDLQRIKVYPAKGFQVYQEIPAEVWQAYERLVELGFTSQLIKE